MLLQAFSDGLCYGAELILYEQGRCFMPKLLNVRLFTTVFAFLLTGMVAVSRPLADNTEAAWDAPTPEVLHEDWMQWLPGSLRMDEISLPTTHDSGTAFCDPSSQAGFGFLWCWTQSMWYDAQLDAGIRAFDVRVYLKLGDDGDPANDWLGQAHGDVDIVDLGDPDRQNIDFAIVLRDTCNWLARHPTEAVVMKVGEDGLGGRHEVEDLEETYENEAWERWKNALRADIELFQWCIWEPPAPPYVMPTLGDLRGKILIRPKGCFEGNCTDIGREFSEDLSGVDGGGASAGERLFNNASLSDAMETLTGVLKWADFVSRWWDLTAGEQAYWRHILPPIPSDPVFIQTGTNGYQYFTTGTPYDFAFGADPWVPQGMNERMLEWLLGIRKVGGDGGLSVDNLGLVSMDFPGASLIGAIIAHNFDLADDAGATGPDFARMLTPIAHQIENEVSNSAAARGGKLAAFLRHVYESTQLHVITVKGKNALVGIDADHNGVFGRTGDVHNYQHIAFMGGRGAAPSAADARNVLQRGVVGGLFGDPGQRARLVGARLREEFPDHDVTVMSWDPGQVSEIDWSLPDGSVRAGPLFDNVGFAYVAWLYNGPKKDTAAPVLTLPRDAKLDTHPGAAGAVFVYAAEVSAVDDVDPDPQVTCTPASGSLFLAGPTTVTCIAVDTSGNEARRQFTVFVLDNEAPVLTVPPDVTLDKDPGSAGAVFEYAGEVSAVDNVDANPQVSCTPVSGSLFPVGPTTVTCTAADAAGNEASEQFTVIVIDSGPPGC